MPALVTLGSDQNLNVKYASIDAFGAVAQHFKNDTVLDDLFYLILGCFKFLNLVVELIKFLNFQIIDKIRIQMDAFLEDGSHEATISVIRALVVAVPHTTERLREYILEHKSKIEIILVAYCFTISETLSTCSFL